MSLQVGVHRAALRFELKFASLEFESLKPREIESLKVRKVQSRKFEKFQTLGGGAGLKA